ncbi:hypothetical protein mhp185 [Mesomycoplasma hyopneumoniae 232]|uniref:Uncharacterized protein n=1 Tax=Mesomycoplasma hyopneumoniae (strain 232) TaxID=295358 RepID=Q601L7_MESH2|nr:hypothetical protein mhp185 [Mesomycoplasma hyopneumoniae 232]
MAKSPQMEIASYQAFFWTTIITTAIIIKKISQKISAKIERFCNFLRKIELKKKEKLAFI